ncbi:MAG: type VII toxin-antitoxin system HepT family RNase toxin [Spirochaetia bacterium]
MSPGKVSRRILLDRLSWVDRMISGIRSLPLQSMSAFASDSRNVWNAESCLRRALEALFDIGRHVLAKGFGKGVSEYREIADKLAESGVLSGPQSQLLKILAGYRNRLVHFYHEVSLDERCQTWTTQLGDVVAMRDAFRAWLDSHPPLIDDSL